MLIKIENGVPVGYPVTEENFRYLVPSHSFPLVLTPEMVEPFGFGMYDYSQIPDVKWNQKLVEGAPVKDAQGIWRQQWVVVDLTGAELQSAQDAEKQRKISALDMALTAFLDQTAQSRRYDNRITCAVRAGYPGPFQAEGHAFAVWMDTCNALAYQMLTEVHAGTRPVPDDPQELIAAMPSMVWPS